MKRDKYGAECLVTSWSCACGVAIVEFGKSAAVGAGACGSQVSRGEGLRWRNTGTQDGRPHAVQALSGTHYTAVLLLSQLLALICGTHMMQTMRAGTLPGRVTVPDMQGGTSGCRSSSCFRNPSPEDMSALL